MTDNQILLYKSDDGEIQIDVTTDGETVWLSLDQMVKLFQRDKSVISRHIKNILETGELEEKAVVAKNATTGADKKTYQVKYYNLDMIISVGYRVNSYRGVQFRIWATKTLREYIIKGFVMDDDRLAGKRGNYFDELVERVRRIRTSEANLYEKVKAIFKTSIDYQSGADIAGRFYATMQNKFHYAITGHTAAELIVNRVNAYKKDMGLVHKKGEKITRQEAEVAKNYMFELELKRLELLVEQFLSFAELQSIEQRPMYMADWAHKLDDFVRLNDKKVLDNPGTVSNRHMRNTVKEEYEKYRSLELGSGMTRRELEESTGKGTKRNDALPPPDDDDNGDRA